MPIKQEIMNKIALLAFKKLQSAVLLEHFYQQHFDVLEQKDKQRVIHRALFYLSLELMVFDYSELTQDNWDYMNGDKYSRAFIMALVKADPVAVLSLTMPQIISLLYSIPTSMTTILIAKLEPIYAMILRCSAVIKHKKLCRGGQQKNGSLASFSPITAKRTS